MTKYRYNTDTNQLIQDNNNLGTSFYQEPWREATQEEITKFKIKEKKQELLLSLDQYHYSDELRKITVNDSIIINYHLEFRQLIDEQIINLQMQIDLKQLTESEANFTYLDINNVDITLTLEQLKKLSVELKKTANSQWKNYIKAKKKINNATKLKTLEDYDIKDGYLKDIKLEIS